MTDELDRRLGRLLRATAVPERDPFFRIGVLERREQQRYQLRRRKLLAVALFVALLHVLFLLALGIGRSSVRSPGDLLEAGLLLAFTTALILAAVIAGRGVLQAWRWIRSR